MSQLSPNKQDNRALTESPAERANMLRTLFERVSLTWRLFWDGRVSVVPKLIPVLAAVYAISPIDIVPALLLGPFAPLGVVDDVGIIILALNLFIQTSPPDIVREHLRELGAAFSPRLRDDDDNVVEGSVEILDE